MKSTKALVCIAGLLGMGFIAAACGIDDGTDAAGGAEIGATRQALGDQPMNPPPLPKYETLNSFTLPVLVGTASLGAACPSAAEMIRPVPGTSDVMVEVLIPRTTKCDGRWICSLTKTHSEVFEYPNPREVPIRAQPGWCYRYRRGIRRHWRQPGLMISRDYDIYTRNLDLASWDSLVQEYWGAAKSAAVSWAKTWALTKIDKWTAIDKGNFLGVSTSGSATDTLFDPSVANFADLAASFCNRTPAAQLVKLGVFVFGATLKGASEFFQAIGLTPAAEQAEGKRSKFFSVWFPGVWEMDPTKPSESVTYPLQRVKCPYLFKATNSNIIIKVPLGSGTSTPESPKQ